MKRKSKNILSVVLIILLVVVMSLTVYLAKNSINTKNNDNMINKISDKPSGENQSLIKSFGVTTDLCL